MISVLIPVYNYDSSGLVRALQKQCTQTGKEFEIICLDDASDEKYRKLNRAIASLPGVIYNELEKNAGRSGARNKLAEMAKYDYFLFMDCDAMPVDDNYIAQYMAALEGDKVIYGGRKYLPQPPAEKELLFHWTYGTQREALPAKVRRARPYERFMTNNFIIPRRIYFAVGMNEELRGYGHEDTLFSMELEKRSVDIVHMDNALYHVGLEPAEIFIDKQKNAIKNLVYIIHNHPLAHRVKLYRFYKKLKSAGVMSILYPRLARKEKYYIDNLTGPQPHIRSLDWLKLLWLHRELKQ